MMFQEIRANTLVGTPEYLAPEVGWGTWGSRDRWAIMDRVAKHGENFRENIAKSIETMATGPQNIAKSMDPIKILVHISNKKSAYIYVYLKVSITIEISKYVNISINVY